MLKKLSKKITAAITAAALGVSLTITTPAVAEASVLTDMILTGVSATMSYNQLNKQLKAFDSTEEGRDALYQQFQEKTGVNNDPVINARMDRIMANLTAAVGAIDESIYEKPYKYYVSADESLNAFCSLGHVMVVNIGAFNHLATDDEIAAIVGHEMGHGQKNHVIKGNKKNLNKMVAAQLGAAAAGGGTLVNIVASVTAQGSIAHGSRKQETEADNLGWDYLLNTDYNLGATAAVMQKLYELSNGAKGGMFSDHPDTDKRRDNYAKKLYEYSGKHASANDGVVTVNGQTFTTVAATNSMSSPERAYFVLGNLARAYHNGKNSATATVQNGTVYLGDQEIITPAASDEDAYTLAERLNAIK